GQIHVHSNLGQIHQVRGQLTDARRHWVESLELFRQLGDAEGSLRTLVNLAASSCDYGQYDEARVYAQQALHEAKKSNIPIGSCFAHLNLGLATHYQGENKLSVDENRAAYQIAIDLGSQRLQAHALSVQGHALVEMEQFSAAEEAYWEAVAIWQRLEIPNMVAEAKAGLARLALRQQNEALAKELASEVWTQIAVDPNLDGAELPVRIYLTCYQVFKKTGDVRADEALSAGRDLLEKQSTSLNDDDVRNSLRQKIPAHRDILAI
ncbi:MAG: tetratricopeptide repeat protein, partial [Anaerolineales bacterium]|nr:tetratricopeptide repeat protein [Anaerolineales bacterium]